MDMSECHLNFREQCALVFRGLKRGFKYDGCTAVPDFDFGSDCCGEHDYHYQDRTITRAEADRRLRDCLRKKGYVVLPWIYWAGVRVFGWCFWKKRQKTVPVVIEDPEVPPVQSQGSS